MKSDQAAVNEVYSILKQAGGVQCPVYKYTKPTAVTPDEFVVINTLPITSGVLQTLRINVNYHVKDLANGVPNVSRLEVMTTFVRGFLEQSNNSPDGIFIDLENQQTIQDRETGCHYSNFRLFVKILNK